MVGIANTVVKVKISAMVRNFVLIVFFFIFSFFLKI